MKDSEQAANPTKKFKLGHLGSLNQVIVAPGQNAKREVARRSDESRRYSTSPGARSTRRLARADEVIE